MKFATAIILYNPTHEIVQHTKEYAESFDIVFVFDNSEPGFVKSYNFGNKSFVYLTQNQNIGLSAAFNAILKYDKTKEYDYLCTLDQDSNFKKEDIKKIKDFITIKHSEFKDNTGIIAPFIDYGLNDAKSNKEYEEKEWVITSGSFFNLGLLRKNNISFDENYFIDKVDADLCKQLKNKGLSIKVYLNSVLYQSLGEFNGYRHTNHSPLRHYYLFRNRFYFNHKHYGFLKCWILNFVQTLRHIALIGVYENNSHKKIKMFFRACIDYLHNKMGKIQNE